MLAKLYAGSPADDRLAPFLARGVLDGYTLSSMSTAFDELSAAPARPSMQRDQLMVVVAMALARETTARPNGLDATTAKDVSSRLAALSADAGVGPAAQQLQRVLFDPPGSASSVPWWRKTQPTVGTPAMSPMSALRDLTIALGVQHGARDRERAERWLRIGIEAGEHGPDPDAFLRLVELYTNTDQSNRLKPLMDQYQWELFSEKSGAYTRGDWPAIYRLHLALGMTYAEMRVWSSSTPFQNAVFQLSNASIAADQINKMPVPAGQQPRRVALPPAAALKLSEGYAATGQSYKALSIKLDSAVKLHEAQRVMESSDLLKTLPQAEVQKLNPADLNKYRGLRAATPG